MLNPDVRALGYHRNKYERFRIGASTPQEKTVKLVEERLPGSRRLLKLLIWKALDPKCSIYWLTRYGLRELPPEIQSIVLPNSRSKQRRPYLQSLNKKLRKLEKDASLDALACLTILLRVCLERNESRSASTIASSTARVLLITCSSWPFYSFALYIFWLYANQFFSQIPTGIFSGWTAKDFLSARNYMGVRQLQLEDAGMVGLGRRDTIKAMLDIMGGKFDFEDSAQFKAMFGAFPF